MVNIDARGDLGPVAVKLLAAAEELGLPASVVQTTSDGLFGLGFTVPDEVAAEAGYTLDANSRDVKVAKEPEPEAAEASKEPEPDKEPEAKSATPVKRGPGRPRKAQG